MKYSEAREYASKLRELADFIEQRGHKLPYCHPTTTVTCYLTETDYEYGENGEYEAKINEAGTKQKIKKFLDAVGPCEKDYRDDKIVITKNYSHGDGSAMIKGTVDRSVACKKVVKGQKLIPATLIQARMEDEVEWVCDEGISLLKLVQ